jgi:hypothetical protein
VAEALTAFLSIPDPLGDETKDAIQEAFDDLDWRLSGLGEFVGSDADVNGVELHLLADEPQRFARRHVRGSHRGCRGVQASKCVAVTDRP